jgi:hypothetical protein
VRDGLGKCYQSGGICPPAWSNAHRASASDSGLVQQPRKNVAEKKMFGGDEN